MGYVVMYVLFPTPPPPGIESSSLEQPPQTEGAAASQGTLAEAEGKGRRTAEPLDPATRVLASLHHHQRSKRPTGVQPRREGGAASRNPKSRENKTQGSKRDAAPHSREKKQRDRPKQGDTTLCWEGAASTGNDCIDK